MDENYEEELEEREEVRSDSLMLGFVAGALYVTIISLTWYFSTWYFALAAGIIMPIICAFIISYINRE